MLDKIIPPVRAKEHFFCCKPRGKAMVMHKLATPFEADIHHRYIRRNYLWLHPARVQRHSTFVIIRSELGFYLPSKRQALDEGTL